MSKLCTLKFKVSCSKPNGFIWNLEPETLNFLRIMLRFTDFRFSHFHCKSDSFLAERN
jgi:hypothetical protein